MGAKDIVMNIEFIDKDISPWSGLVLMEKMMYRMNLSDAFSAADLPTQGSNRGYSPEQLIKSFWVSLWCGASCFEHTEILREDHALKELFGWKRMAGHKAYQRYFNKFDQATNQRCFTNLQQWFFNNLSFDNYTVDFDSTVLTRWGNQEGACKGYNPSKPGRKSHHPLIAFIPVCRMIANCWLRPGNTAAMNNFIHFLYDTLEKLKGKKVGLVRADSGFFCGEILDELEKKENQIPYIIACRFNARVKYTIIRHQTWWEVCPGIEIAETTYQADTWTKPRRIVMVRQEEKKRANAVGKKITSGCLFPEEYEADKYRYSCYVTNMALPADLIWRNYRTRADSENRIKEIKHDFAFDHFVLKDFWASEAAMNFIAMAYNLISLFRHTLINSKQKPFLKTIRYKLFAIPGYISSHAKGKTLKLALGVKRRSSFMGIWKAAQEFDPKIMF